MNITNRINATFFNDEEFLERIKYNKDGYYIHQKSKKKNLKVTVIIPVYNADETLKKTIDSVVNQTIGLEDIELLIIDDKSEDSSRLIILNYAKEHPNIVPVFLENNTGSPATPRNLGIDLAKGKYITFIDSDDWFHKKGIEVLYSLLEKTGDNYGVGKTIKLNGKGQYIVGEYNNWSVRESITPYSISKIFYHLGPTARMIKTDFLKKNNIRFPNMKFAEDKQFFIDVLINCKSISTSNEVIYYANRYKENKSLTTTTNIFEKTDMNISLIKYVIQKELSPNIEKMILNRLYEFDCITRLFDRHHFLKSKDKEAYYDKFTEVLATTENLRYDFTDDFFEPWHKILVDLFKKERFEDIVTLIKWNKNEVTKDYFIENNLPYYSLPFNDNDKTRINMLATHHKIKKEKDKLVIQVKVYGDYIEDINNLVIRERNNDLNDVEFPIKKIEYNVFETHIPYAQLEDLSYSSHSIYIKYLDYMKIPIRMNVRNIINYNDSKLDFYTTISDNFALNIKS